VTDAHRSFVCAIGIHPTAAELVTLRTGIRVAGRRRMPLVEPEEIGAAEMGIDA
jgi:hypothetical protein